MYRLRFIISIFICYCGIVSAQLTETHSVFFEVDEDVILETEGKQLNNFFDELLYKPILEVKILGYCDDRGSYEYNLKLSNRRVETVSQWLQDHNIAVDNISKIVEGKGEIALRKNADGSVADERAHNRRVDITFSLAAEVVDRIAIKKLNKEELTTTEAEQIKTYQDKVVNAIQKDPDGSKEIELAPVKNTETKELPEDEFLVIPTKIDPPIDNNQEPFKSLLSKKLKAGQVIRLENILFYKGRSTILEESQPLLDRVAEILVARKDIKFEIHGHVCCINPVYEDAYNRDTRKSNLSHDRAKAIYQILRKRGVNYSRMKFKGFGRTKPLGGIDKLDRRVELFITHIDPS